MRALLIAALGAGLIAPLALSTATAASASVSSTASLSAASTRQALPTCSGTRVMILILCSLLYDRPI
ncbi:hypothetical protein [Microtetraspora sp. NBRC 16547]|uniref:hypothetical protein n=1 Tax=Microtetraspora sp. NBRC 16547 TaxID=3030993 RepID=UPI00255658E0|nr:hypothetical protein [Microtetraspora sp. NBRC 16547]